MFGIVGMTLAVIGIALGAWNWCYAVYEDHRRKGFVIVIFGALGFVVNFLLFILETT